jgi:hypothetical protein
MCSRRDEAILIDLLIRPMEAIMEAVASLQRIFTVAARAQRREFRLIAVAIG